MGGGRADVGLISQCARNLGIGIDDRVGMRANLADPRSLLVVEPLRWAIALRPRWVALEQVPPVLSLWKFYATVLETLGYSTWAGTLNAADYGVPQTRERAFLLASLEGAVHPPRATHCRDGAITLEGELLPWVTMAEALGWNERDLVGFPRLDDTPSNKSTVAIELSGKSYRRRDLRLASEPAFVLTEKSRSWTRWPWTSPSTTVAGDPRVTARCHHDEGSQGANAKTTDQVQDGDYEGTEPIRLTTAEAAILQGFPPDHPWRGTQTAKHLQIGNAVPPPLAKAVLEALLA